MLSESWNLRHPKHLNELKMTQKEFIEQHKAICRDHDLWFEDNCDLWSIVDGMIYYRNSDEKQVAHITGIYYDHNGGGIMGDYDGYLELLRNELR